MPPPQKCPSPPIVGASLLHGGTSVYYQPWYSTDLFTELFSSKILPYSTNLNIAASWLVAALPLKLLENHYDTIIRLIRRNHIKCVWCNSVYDGFEKTWKMKWKSWFWQIWITSLARPICRPFETHVSIVTHTLGTAGLDCKHSDT